LAIEDLAISNLAHNNRLARPIGDAAWSEFARQLAYKAEWYGAELVVCDRWLASSKTCSRCGARKERIALAERVFPAIAVDSPWTGIATPRPTSPPGPSMLGPRTAKRAAGSPMPLEGKALAVAMATGWRPSYHTRAAGRAGADDVTVMA
jgi:putative transposase-like DNA-binding protein